MAHGAFGAMGGLQTSANDYARWVAFLLAGWPPRDGAEAGPVRRSTVRELAQGANFPRAARARRAPAPSCRQASTYAMGIDRRARLRPRADAQSRRRLPGLRLPRACCCPTTASASSPSRTGPTPGRARRCGTRPMALHRAGALEGPADPARARSTHAYARVGRIYARRRPSTAAGDVLAMNLPIDRYAAHRARDLADLKAQVGACDTAAIHADRRPLRPLHLDVRARPRQRIAAAGADADAAHPGARPVAGHAVSQSGRARVALAVVVGLLGWTSLAAAHPAPFSFLDLHLDAARVGGTLTIHDLDAARELGLADTTALLDAAAAGRHGAVLAALLTRRLVVTIDGQPVAVTLSDMAALPDRQALRFTLAAPTTGRPGRVAIDPRLFPYDPMHQTFVNVYEDGGLRYQAIFDRGDGDRLLRRLVARRRRGAGDVRAGRRPSHPIGPDHILFLVGLLLLGAKPRRRLADRHRVHHRPQPDAVAGGARHLHAAEPPRRARHRAEHRVGRRRQPARPPERLPADAPTRPAAVDRAGVFGFVHGFGFASGPERVRAAARSLGWSLFFFNVGVEIGQLVIVGVVRSLLALIAAGGTPGARAAAGGGRLDRGDRGGHVLVHPTSVLHGRRIA